jgi:hypothetical protein
VGSSPSAGNALIPEFTGQMLLDFLFEELGEFPLKSGQQKDLESEAGQKSSSLSTFCSFGPLTVAGVHQRERYPLAIPPMEAESSLSLTTGIRNRG